MLIAFSKNNYSFKNLVVLVSSDPFNCHIGNMSVSEYLSATDKQSFNSQKYDNLLLKGSINNLPVLTVLAKVVKRDKFVGFLVAEEKKTYKQTYLNFKALTYDELLDILDNNKGLCMNYCIVRNDSTKYLRCTQEEPIELDSDTVYEHFGLKFNNCDFYHEMTYLELMDTLNNINFKVLYKKSYKIQKKEDNIVGSFVGPFVPYEYVYMVAVNQEGTQLIFHLVDKKFKGVYSLTVFDQQLKALRRLNLTAYDNYCKIPTYKGHEFRTIYLQSENSFVGTIIEDKEYTRFKKDIKDIDVFSVACIPYSVIGTPTKYLEFFEIDKVQDKYIREYCAKIHNKVKPGKTSDIALYMKYMLSFANLTHYKKGVFSGYTYFAVNEFSFREELKKELGITKQDLEGIQNFLVSKCRGDNYDEI